MVQLREEVGRALQDCVRRRKDIRSQVEYEIILGSLDLSDQELESISERLQELIVTPLLELDPAHLPVALDISLENNFLQGSGIASLCTLLANVREMGFAFTRCMKLHHNSLNDSAAGPIAQLIRCQLDHPEYKGGPSVVQELHLSHNQFTDKGVRTISNAVIGGGYPFHTYDRSRIPLWIRVEQNPSTPLRRLLGDPNLVCDARGPNCGPRKCACKPVPPFHSQ